MYNFQYKMFKKIKVPYRFQGALFAPIFLALIFILKITCPGNVDGSCFADIFVPVIFFPLRGIYGFFSEVSFVNTQEPILILFYWILIGFFAGYSVDLYLDFKEESKEKKERMSA